MMVFQHAVHHAMNEEWKRQYDSEFLDEENNRKIEKVMDIPFERWPTVPALGLSFLIIALERRGYDVEKLYFLLSTE